ncbi:hypothetical protein PCC8801_4557 (plasmid) [Rippkaea orientalis PCC 8801]|uniref:Uncharacterized protein n=2 Tax=Rippkaea TaxID=2546365 RepID=B7K6P3_RIPO1|nr:hypothetical protein PCC8801_4557 [Rippkaea orientalis PCC 8801]
MGKAKRRKKLTPTHGKGFGSKNQQSLNLFLMGDIGLKCYEIYGRGILFNIPHSAPKYVLSSCSWLKLQEIELINTYNPSEEVILAEFIEPLKSSGRMVKSFSFELANQMRVFSTHQTIEELVSKMFVATADNEPS